ncbi:saccharopine dehydrogenase NADP-binding domain-containing protein [Cellulophaga baltica]|uniref:saccharopine dehydrogenase family protein n=1 Tax=Cellulophaga TaxID=104264 RepID=UPI001C06557B|nr:MULTISPECIES: saccharopine dehydrogenase family protein [Cellulophaga]MBU2995557.1 saccharopine dehydrogenase NADP-binding domain-containing protein [Cellulophaga baltica]MDO6766951.1 saccharopine dehydrogenase NADP-binding domain-containing protein [Cellulophaga sp. 1_MG-2023]
MLRKILVIGAGKSTSYLLDYFLEQSDSEKLHITIADINPEQIPVKFKVHSNFTILKLDSSDTPTRETHISQSDIVVSMLPAFLHTIIAKDCIKFKKHLVTASYVSDKIKLLDEEAKKNNLIFMNEIGLDPGIDHMSALQVINTIKEKGGNILLFESFTGGLVAPESDTNLWNYKFTWNPRNVVLAGQGGTAKFIQEGTYKYIPYHKIFRRTEFIEVDGFGKFEVYPNRDSLKYREAYGLTSALTLYRGTIRRVGFSKAWNMFVQLGMTDDSYTIANSRGMSYREFVNLFLPYSPTNTVELKLRHYLKIDQDDVMWEKLKELNLFHTTKIITLENATPAQVLQFILEDSWSLANTDKDMIVMYHKFGYELNGKKKQLDSHMVVMGENRSHTAMAKTVGLPVAIATLLILNKKITTPGVQIPLQKEVYTPILSELKKYGIIFKEKEAPYLGYNLEV